MEEEVKDKKERVSFTQYTAAVIETLSAIFCGPEKDMVPYPVTVNHNALAALMRGMSAAAVDETINTCFRMGVDVFIGRLLDRVFSGDPVEYEQTLTKLRSQIEEEREEI